MDWDAAYSNVDHVADAAAYPERWAAAAAAFRDGLGPRAEIDIAYGPDERERYDLFMPEGNPAGLAIFVHGGYWLRLDNSLFSHLAAGALARGWAVAMPAYPLCPKVRVSEITASIREAVRAIASRVPGPMALAGHSAGGHLVTRMICADAALPDDLRGRLQSVLSISGVHDLRPVLQTQMNADLHLDPAEATAESPALQVPDTGARVTCWVGAAELPEFVRQNALLANIWAGFGLRISAHEAPQHNHFSVIEDLADPDGAMVRAWLAE